MDSIEHIIYIKAPKETVYSALTSEEGLSEIWTKKLKVKPEVGFINEFDFDEGYITKFIILELVENSKIVWECIASDEEWIGTKVSFELTGKDNRTTIILKHFNWRERTDFYRWCNYNWAMFLYRLKNYCEN
ncbi:SRPBCC domain-containing protein [uncultured Marixanthomonas sp.]|uniref:SRPBCC family protein n=1 Tax=uncultured Marixanthomonas sp. TaxID=757245 RepID=UPI0030DD2F9A|tara:strand:+ start:8852 stop:9247 length:396 start_codon:yes stop_codon:yes gene_type:complete